MWKSYLSCNILLQSLFFGILRLKLWKCKVITFTLDTWVQLVSDKRRILLVSVSCIWMSAGTRSSGSWKTTVSFSRRPRARKLNLFYRVTWKWFISHVVAVFMFQHHHSIRVDNHADKDLLMFVDMLKQMLHLDADQRMTLAQVLEHEFIACISRPSNKSILWLHVTLLLETRRSSGGQSDNWSILRTF